MSKIALQFVCGADLSSRLIAWYGNGFGGWSHVDAVLPSGSLLGARSDVLEGIPSGVQIRPPHYERWVRTARVELTVSPQRAQSWEVWLKGQCGKQYDKGSIWGFILGKKDHEANHWICSALQTGALKHIGMLHPFPIPDSQVTPDALYLIVTAGLGGKVS